MIWLTTRELVETVRRALLETILPAVDDEFARVQAVAAVHALLEVGQRLGEGDPISADTAAVTALLEQWGRPSRPASVDPRADNAAAREELARAVAESGDDAKLSELRLVESALAEQDSRWICREAMASLE